VTANDIVRILLEDDEDPKKFVMRMPDPACKKCGSKLVRGYCVDETCPYSDWPQQISLDDLRSTGSDQIENKYGVQDRRRPLTRRIPNSR